MPWILLSLLLIGLGFAFDYCDKIWGDGWANTWDTLALMGWIFGTITLFLALIFIPINRNCVLAGIERHEAIRQTVAITREMGESTKLERIKLTESILETNTSLAKTKYYASHPWFKLYYPKEILDVEPIY